MKMGAALKSSLLLACVRTTFVYFALFNYVLVFQLLPFLSCERMVIEGSLQECKGEQGRICDGAVTKELSNSKQVSKMYLLEMNILVSGLSEGKVESSIKQESSC